VSGERHLIARHSDRDKGDVYMSMKPNALKAMGIEQEKIDQIIEMHNETIASIKADKDKALKELEEYKERAGRVDELEKELSKLKDTSSKYESLKTEYDNYKSEITAKETKAAKSKAYRDMLKDIGISDKRIDSVMRVADLDSIELENGKIKGVDELKESAKNEWADFIVSTGVVGAQTPTPPTNTGGTKTKEEILNIKDTSKRQAAIAENHELFGF